MSVRNRRIAGAVLAVLGIGLAATAAAGETATTGTAPPAVAYDERGWRIDGRPRLVLSAEFDYARLPREVWEQRLLLVRSAGFNAVTIPVFWGFHESQPGRFDFDGRRDLERVLDLCRRRRLWAIVRMGPWVGGDWELGGLPAWLPARTPRLRQRNPRFLAAADRWFETLATRLADRQIHRGGAVIGVEIEAIHRGEARRYDPGYFDHFRRLAQACGIAVPVIASPDAAARGRFETSLFWADLELSGRRAIVPLGEARAWGESDVVRDRSADVARLLARGVRWLDCRHVLGGTNFGVQAASGVPARYDCGAPIGRTGDLRASYYALKSRLLWARSAESILAATESESTTATLAGGRTLPAWRFRAVDGELLLLENPRPRPCAVAVSIGSTSPTTERIRWEGRGIRPIVRDWRLSPGVTVEESAARLYHAGRIGGRRLLVAALGPDEERTIAFRTTETPRFDAGRDAFTPTAGGCLLRVGLGPEGQTRDFGFTAGERVRVVAISEALFARMWILGDEEEGELLVFGGDALLDADTATAGRTEVVLGQRSRPGEIRVYGDAARVTLPFASTTSPATINQPPTAEIDGGWIIPTAAREGGSTPTSRLPPQAPALRWEQRDDSLEIQPGFDDSAWIEYPEPFSQERLIAESAKSESNPLSPFTWYRTTLEVPAWSTYTLRLGGIGDRAHVFLEGRRAHDLDGARTDECRFILRRGQYNLAILVEHDGRDELSAPGRLAPEHVFKGLRPPVAFAPGGLRWQIPWWQFVVRDDRLDASDRPIRPASTAQNWQLLTAIGPDDMNGRRGYAEYRTWFEAPREGTLEIQLTGADDRAWVYLGDTLVGMHDDADRARVIRLPETLPARGRAGRTPALTIVVENRRGPGGLVGPVRIGITQAYPGVRLGRWRMCVGLRGEREGWFRPDRLIADEAQWTEITTPTRHMAARWYRTRFLYDRRPANLASTLETQDLKPETRNPEPASRDSTPETRNPAPETLFLHLGSLRRGVVWLNGHCLGRYRNVGWDAEHGVHLPACWLQPLNWLVVAETAGGVTEGTSLAATGSSRYAVRRVVIDHGSVD